MKERLVADWLTKAGERGGLDVAFCQLLLSQGCRILRAGHGPTEAGKDVIAIAPQARLHAYQIKQGDIDLKAFNQIQPQLVNLVEAAVSHPNLKRGSKHQPFLVTTGKFSAPVESLVHELNDAWSRRGFHRLHLIGGSELHPQFVAMAENFWPVDPPEVRAFLSLYLAEGKGDFDQPGFAAFMGRVFPRQRPSAPLAARQVAAANLFASYLLEPFFLHGDHWSSFTGWTITAAHQLWMAEVHKVGEKAWRSSFELARAAAIAALQRISSEALESRALSPQGPEHDDYTRLRNTMTASAVAAWHLLQIRIGNSPPSIGRATLLLERLARNGRLWFWGESALPNFCSIIWFLDKTGKWDVAEQLLVTALSIVSNRNRHNSSNPFPGPEVLSDQVLADILNSRKARKDERRRRAVYSWSIEILIHLVARRLRRQALAAYWSQITNVTMATFIPQPRADFLLWHCEKGEEATRQAGKPQSWKELLAVSRENDLSLLPDVLNNDPEFALMFALTYPHRANLSLIKALDSWFS